MELLTKIKELARGKKAAVLTGYRSAVEAVATGKRADPEKVAELIGDAGKTPEEFEADVTTHAERLRLRGVADNAPTAEKVAAETKAKIDGLEKRLAEKVAEVQNAAQPLHAAVREAERILDAARQAEDELRRTYPSDGPARAEYAEAQRRAAKLDAERHELREKLRRFEGEVAGLRSKIDRDRGTTTTTGTAAHPADPGSLAYAEQTLADLRRRLAESEAATAATAAQMTAATHRMGQP